MKNRSPIPWCSAAALACALGACADQPVAPANTSVPAVAHAGPRLISNAVRYRDEGGRPALARSGSASLTVLAMLDDAGITEVEVVSGTRARPGGGAGTLERVQSTARVGERGEHVLESSFGEVSGGRLTYRLRGPVRGAVLQVRAAVRGIEGARRDVVTVRGSVLLRPDLRVALFSPARVRPGAPVNITAAVSERNGDLGARAHCVLYVDGAEVDRARGIWVDAGDEVSCVFARTFSRAGAHRVEVRVEGVSPGDYTSANNTASRTITVVNATPLAYTAEARDSRGTSWYSNSWEYRERGGSSGVDQQNHTERYADQHASIYGWHMGRLALPVQARLSQSSGGRTYNDTTLQGLGAGTAGDYCASTAAGASGETTFSLCTWVEDGQTWTTWQYERVTGSVAYHSSLYSARWDPAGTPEYVYVTTSSSASGTPPPVYGSTYTFGVTLTDAAGQVYAASAVVPLHTSTSFYESPEHCSSLSNAAYSFVAYCWSNADENTTLSGDLTSYLWGG